MASDTFGLARRPAGKEFRDGTVGEALDDLYSDVDVAFATAEQTGAMQRANLQLAAVPADADTVTIGGQVYEFLDVGTNSQANSVCVFRGTIASIALCYQNLGLALAGTGTAIADGLTGPAGGVPIENGNQPVRVGTIAANDAQIFCVDAAGNETQGLPVTNIALAEGLANAASGWNMPALNAAATTVTGSRTAVVGPITYDLASEFAGQAAWEIVLPFLPRAHMASAQVTATGVEIAPAGVTVTYSVVAGENIALIEATTLVAGAGTADGSEDITVVFYE